MSKGMLMALALSVLLAISLSWLPDQALQRWGGGDAVDEGRSTPVSQQQVVDVLAGLSLSSHLQKVVWESDRLTVWLAVPGAKLAQNRPWNDIYKIAYRFLVGQSPYREVEVRVVASEKPDQVQMAVIAQDKDMVGAPQPGTQQSRSYVQQKLNVIEKKAQ
jgi:hypothetical protein